MSNRVFNEFPFRQLLCDHVRRELLPGVGDAVKPAVSCDEVSVRLTDLVYEKLRMVTEN